jgi:hypothetical protein
MLGDLHGNEDPSIDKRGLCYTLNYLSRAYLTVGIHSRSTEIGEASYRFNTLVGDITGCCVAAGTVGYGYSAQEQSSEACGWFERSFGHGWAIGHGSQGEMALRMCMTAGQTNDEAKKAAAEFHLRQVALRSAVVHFPKSTLGNEIPDLLLTGRGGLETLRFADRTDPLLGEDTVRFVNGFREWIGRETLDCPGTGRSTANWTGDGSTVFEWMTGSATDLGQGVSGTRLTIAPLGSEDGYEFLLLREEVGAWRMVSMRRMQGRR